jgi:hypothetical protein
MKGGAASMKLLMLSVMASVCMYVFAIVDATEFLHGQAAHDQQADHSQKDVTIPFQLVNKTIFIQVMVAHKPLWFVLDTGDKYAIIDLSTARSLGLELGDQVPVGGGGKDTVMGNYLKNSEFRVTGLENFSQPLFIAVPLEELAKASGHELAGVLGFDFVSQFAIEIDYLKQAITLHDKAAYQYHGDGDSLPITFNAAGHPVVHAQVVDETGSPVDGRFVFDIGSGAALILNTPFVDKERFLQAGQQTVPWLEGLGFGGGIEGSVGRMKRFKLGRFLINNPVTVFSQASNGPFASAETQGNIGAAILEKFKIILDYNQHRIILESNAQFNKPIEYNRSGLFLVSSGTDYETFKIEAIADNSPASEAGFHTGDIVIAINGYPASEYTLSELRMMFQDAKQCELTVQRGRENLQMMLKLRRLI